MLKTDQTMEMFAYPENSYGTVYTTLYAPLTSELRDSGLRSGNLFRIGLWEKASTRNEEVQNFLDAENINYKIIYYSSQEEQQAALFSGEVDLISGLSLSPVPNTRIIEKFAARPYYFAATKGKEELVSQLDEVIAEINRLQPRLQDSLFDEYFLSSENTFLLTEEQKEKLKGLSELQVLCVDRDAPYVYQVDGEPRGALILALNDFAETVGLQIHYTFCDGRSEAEQLLEEKSYDILLGMPFTSAYCAEKGFIKTESILTSGLAFVRKSSDSTNGKVAIVRGLEEIIDTSLFREVVLVDNAGQCIENLRNGSVDVAAGDRSVLEYYIYDTGNTFATSLIAGGSQNICMAVSRTQDPVLLEVMNNYIYSISDYTKTTYLEAGNEHSENETLSRYIARHPVQASLIIGFMTALVVAAVMMVIYSVNMKRKNEELRRANEAKSRFLSRMSHDIRTPLNGIIGLLKIDETHYDNMELVQDNHKKMLTSANHLLSLINDVLQMSKLEDGRAELTYEAFSLEEMSGEVGAIIGVRSTEAGITLETGSQELPESWVYGSPLHLRQLFLNVYGNCIKYNKPGGKVRTELNCIGIREGKVIYRWTISDTGIGMSEEFLKHIFDPFAQERTDARSVYFGTGLGMTIVKSLVDQMGGTITVTSKEGEGSTFVITLPFELAKEVSERLEISDEENVSIEGLHLLLAEDNDLNAEIAEILLGDAGAEVTTVENGQKVVELFESSAPGTFDAILMDVMMPVMDGIEATKEIRSLEREDAGRIPIIAMTANAFEEDAKKCLDAGMNAHLTKPLHMNEVITTIGHFCREVKK